MVERDHDFVGSTRRISACWNAPWTNEHDHALESQSESLSGPSPHKDQKGDVIGESATMLALNNPVTEVVDNTSYAGESVDVDEDSPSPARRQKREQLGERHRQRVDE